MGIILDSSALGILKYFSGFICWLEPLQIRERFPDIRATFSVKLYLMQKKLFQREKMRKEKKWAAVTFKLTLPELRLFYFGDIAQDKLDQWFSNVFCPRIILGEKLDHETYEVKKNSI